jgi:hypothetical protein
MQAGMMSARVKRDREEMIAQAKGATWRWIVFGAWATQCAFKATRGDQGFAYRA